MAFNHLSKSFSPGRKPSDIFLLRFLFHICILHLVEIYNAGYYLAPTPSTSWPSKINDLRRQHDGSTVISSIVYFKLQHTALPSFCCSFSFPISAPLNISPTTSLFFMTEVIYCATYLTILSRLDETVLFYLLNTYVDDSISSNGIDTPVSRSILHLESHNPYRLGLVCLL